MAKGKLFVVSTPIGNLEDITLRALNTFKKVDFLISEKTKKTFMLLNHFGLKKRIIHFSQRMRNGKIRKILSEIEHGKDAALVVEAGTPGISDPGEKVVREAINRGIEVIPVPGPSAVTCALSVSGAPTGKGFVFLGFPPLKKRKKFFTKLPDFGRTVVIFESPHRLLKTLSELAELYPDANVVVMKELTKIHEEKIRGKIREVVQQLNLHDIKGEFTLIIWFD